MTPADTLQQLHITLNGCQVSYGDLIALQCDSRRIEGNIIALIGHNGSGKSTMIKSLLELLPLDRGSITAERWDGAGYRRLRPERHMAFSPERGAIFEDIMVEDYLKLWCRLKQRNSAWYRKHGSHYLESLNITPLLRRKG
ncbi:MAG: ATP-binding cassette domain-containing protein, partial [Bdellovibrionales bacterium]|nr:ATP-binding cassette domain-containing protein [Bdellovibrionales bacterium]